MLTSVAFVPVGKLGKLEMKGCKPVENFHLPLWYFSLIFYVTGKGAALAIFNRIPFVPSVKSQNGLFHCIRIVNKWFNKILLCLPVLSESPAILMIFIERTQKAVNGVQKAPEFVIALQSLLEVIHQKKGKFDWWKIWWKTRILSIWMFFVAKYQFLFIWIGYGFPMEK